MNHFKKQQIQNIADFNPREQLAKGALAKSVPMAMLKEFQRQITGYEIKAFNGGAKFRNGDTLLAKITPCLENGKTAFVDILDDGEVAFGSTEFIVLRAKNETNPEFLYYFAISPDFRKRAIECMEGTSGRQRVNENALKTLELPIPEPQIQQSIAAVLSALDKKIALNKQINTRLEEMAKTLYDYWFVQFDFPDANGKPYKSSGGDMVFDETLKREIPKGWGSIELQSCLAKIPNTTKILNKDIKDFGKYPVVDQSQDFICGFTNDEKSILNPQDAHIIFGDHTRIVKLVNFQYARGADGTQVILSNNERMPNYLFYQIINQIDLSSYGYARHFKFLKEFKIILPSKDISQKYNEIANT
ncbi:TPA: restriction endonuclease subunit S, partial [Neisseria gonorrhoeae]